MKVNANIKKYLDEHGITQVFLSQKTGIDRSAVARIVNSKRRITAEELSKIANALGVDANIFF